MALQRLSPVTKRNYMMRINLYLNHIHKDPDTFVKETRKRPKEFEKQFIAFLQEWGKGARPSTVAFVRDSLRRFLQVNRVGGIDWNYVSDFIPQRRKYGEDRAPTIEEIRRIVSTADLRLRCLVLFLCSSGSRIGAIEYLKWRDIQHLEHEGQVMAGVTIYSGEPERYTTFITPEAYSHLLEYKKMRENIGEKVTPNSHVFVTLTNVDNFRPEAVKPISVSSMKNLLGRHLRKLGMRSVIHEARDYHSFDFKQAHGFRKFFKTRMEMKGVKPIITEMLMGHTLGVSSSYMKPSEKEMMEEYVKAIPGLTVLTREEKVDVKNELKTQLMMVAGFKEEEIRKLDLSKTSDEEFQKMVREKLLGSMANNGNHQKVIPLNEVENFLTMGWEYVAALPDGKAVLKLPN